MTKSPDAFRTISEVAEWLGVQAHVLRFWESKFSQVKPVKRAGGRRYYRPNDMLLLGGIKKLLHDDGMTIKGAQKMLREQGVAAVSAMSAPVDGHHIDADPIDAGATETDQAGGAAIKLDVPTAASDGQVLPFPGADAADPEAESLLSRMEAPDPAPAPATEAPAPDAPAETSAAPDSGSGLAEDAATPEAEAAPEADDFEEFGLGATVAATEADRAPPDQTGTAADAALEIPETEGAETALPSFLNRRLAPESDTPAKADEETEPRKPRIVDAPDPPADDQIEHAPGTLSRIAGPGALDRADRARLAAVMADLRRWHTRATSVAGR